MSSFNRSIDGKVRPHGLGLFRFQCGRPVGGHDHNADMQMKAFTAVAGCKSAPCDLKEKLALASPFDTLLSSFVFARHADAGQVEHKKLKEVEDEKRPGNMTKTQRNVGTGG